MSKMPKYPLRNSLMIAWKPECFRSASTAMLFGSKLCLIGSHKRHGKISLLFNYIDRMIATLRLLVRERPASVICLNQPPMLPMVCWLYSRFTGAAVIMDFHSGAISKPQWKIFLPFLRHVARKSPFTICHNRFDGKVVASWHARVLHILSIPRDELGGVSYAPRGGRPLYLFSCSFAEDEPVDVAIEAMKSCPEFDFVISGNYRKRQLDPAAQPPNIRLAGFMDFSDYLATLAQSSAVISLSTRPHIMQMAIEEALSAGIPVVTNTSPTLSEVLGEGASFSDLDASSLAAAFRDVAECHALRAQGITKAKQAVYAQISNEISSVKQIHREIFA
ncbi:glycosyltransferase [Rhizobium giardinii]|uniref:Glycosyltransferase involved in cell wall biosynthesis n=1 Tax=Rhizobium giardinii TaxID=56731 RepID=A0A7W8UDN7_9HYPH|nr:glycosyltransferase [Rhizobium giardinii]MBB5537472.1 glycosyltransferase involved in cell wall biosynthesis [Rhizobium giardinii]